MQITFEEGPQLPPAASISHVTCQGQSDHSMVRICCSELYGAGFSRLTDSVFCGGCGGLHHGHAGTGEVWGEVSCGGWRALAEWLVGLHLRDCKLMSSGRALGTDASVQLCCVGAEPKYQGPTVNRAPVTGTSSLPRVQSLK